MRDLDKLLRFGAALPLTGEFHEEGRAIADGYQFWQQAVNRAGGLSIAGRRSLVELVLLDTISNDEHAAQCYASLIELHGARFLLGSYPTAANLRAMRLAHVRGLPLVTASGAGEVAFDQGFRGVFGLLSPAQNYLLDTVEVCLASACPPRTFALICCDEPAAREDADRIHAHCLALGLRAVPCAGRHGKSEPGRFPFPHGIDQFADLVTDVAASRPDLLLCAWHQQESVTAILAAARAGLTPRFWAMASGPTAAGLHQALAQDGWTADGLIEPVQWSPALAVEASDRFWTPAEYARQFEAAFGTPPGSYAAGASACGVFYEAAFERAGSTDPVVVSRALEALGREGQTTFYGSVRLDARGLNVAKPLVTVQVHPEHGQLRMGVLAPQGLHVSPEPVRQFAWIRRGLTSGQRDG